MILTSTALCFRDLTQRTTPIKSSFSSIWQILRRHVLRIAESHRGTNVIITVDSDIVSNDFHSQGTVICSWWRQWIGMARCAIKILYVFYNAATFPTCVARWAWATQQSAGWHVRASWHVPVHISAWKGISSSDNDIQLFAVILCHYV